MTRIKPEVMDWTLWFYWIMATTTGWIIGQLFNGIPIVIAGAAISALQWAVLYKRIHKAWRWGVFSTMGWIGGYILCVILFSENTTGVLLGPSTGVATGITQWLILKNEFDWAGWWVVISLLAWTTGLLIMPGLLTSGALPGALTGLALVILFRFSSKGT